MVVMVAMMMTMMMVATGLYCNINIMLMVVMMMFLMVVVYTTIVARMQRMVMPDTMAGFLLVCVVFQCSLCLSSRFGSVS